MPDSILPQKSYYAIYLLLITSFLSACSDPGLTDLEEYVAKVKAKTNPPIDQIPPYEHIPPHYYEVQDLRDPFIPLIEKSFGAKMLENEGTNSKSTKKKCPNPNPNRVRVGLEAIPLDALKMVGWMEKEGKLMALIRIKGDGTIFYVKEYDYLGENYGKVISLSPRQIEVLEQIPDGRGCWKTEVSVISLSTEYEKR